MLEKTSTAALKISAVADHAELDVERIRPGIPFESVFEDFRH
jgi:hypothetical protein